MTWSAGLSREAAISSGRRSCLRPSIVAWATLMPLEDPRDFAMMSFTPAISRMARAAPPAMTPVPGAEDRVDDRRAREGHVEEVLARLFNALLHRETGFLGLAVPETDAALAVTDHHER